jgi:hypothetical protein
VVFAAELALLWLAERDGQRAEYYADALAARAGGTAAGVSPTPTPRPPSTASWPSRTGCAHGAWPTDEGCSFVRWSSQSESVRIRA